MDINITFTFQDFFTYFLPIASLIATVLIGHYTLIADRPKLFLKTTYVKKGQDIFFNLSFINYGLTPAFGVNLKYDGNFIDNFISKAAKKENYKFVYDALDFDFINALNKYEYDDYVANLNREEQNKKYLTTLFLADICFLEPDNRTSKILGIQTLRHSEGSLINSTHSVTVNYKDIRNLNLPFLLFAKFLYYPFFFYFILLGVEPLLHYFLYKTSDYLGCFLDFNSKKYLRSICEVLNFTIETPIDIFNYNLECKEDLLTINKNIFNDQIYSTWEKNLTKDEYNVFKKYRFKYGDEIHKYLLLYKNIDKEIPNKLGLKRKISELIELFYIKGIAKRGLIIYNTEIVGNLNQ